MADVDATIARALAAEPDTSALLLDFDGTLAPIVDDPAEAVARPESLDALGRIATKLRRVAVISGRPVEYLVRRVPVARVEFAGLYGIESWVDGARTIDPRAVPYLDAVAAAADEAEARLPGLLVERKADVAVTIHWRTNNAEADEGIAVANELAARYGLEAPLRSRMAAELRPPVPVDKGTATNVLIEGSRRVVFIGDDAGDLPVFDALDRALADGRLAERWCVAVENMEAPLEVVARSQATVRGAGGTAAFLTTLADALT